MLSISFNRKKKSVLNDVTISIKWLANCVLCLLQWVEEAHIATHNSFGPSDTPAGQSSVANLHHGAALPAWLCLPLENLRHETTDPANVWLCYGLGCWQATVFTPYCLTLLVQSDNSGSARAAAVWYFQYMMHYSILCCSVSYHMMLQFKVLSTIMAVHVETPGGSQWTAPQRTEADPADGQTADLLWLRIRRLHK